MGKRTLPRSNQTYSRNLQSRFSLFRGWKNKGNQRLAWYDYNRQDTRSPGNKNIKGPFFLGWLAQLYRQETYTRETHQSDVTQHDPRAHPSSCQNQIHFFLKKSNGTYYFVNMFKGRLCTLQRGSLNTFLSAGRSWRHFNKSATECPHPRSAALTYTGPRSPGPAAVHILRSPDFFRRINKKRPRSIRPSLLVFIVVWKTFLGMIENCRRRFDADSLKGKWWSREGGTLHLEANSAAGCRCTY